MKDTRPDMLVHRRHFLKTTGVGAALLLSRGLPIAGPFEGLPADHLVPVDKKLTADWIKSLYERGQRTWYSGADLDTIGMPVGGLCAGQVYLTGDGRLVYWEIFNQQFNTGYGAINYKVKRTPTAGVKNPNFIDMPDIEQGAAIRIQQGNKTIIKKLDRSGFPNVSFSGEYPVAIVEFPDASLPVELKLEAFSPFIPLNEEDSSLPATLLNYTVKNTSSSEVTFSLAAWLQNASGFYSRERFDAMAERENRVSKTDGMVAVQGSIKLKDGAQRPVVRPPVVFADFEGADYGGWKAEGEAFGKSPAHGTLANQQAVSGFAGKGLVNTFLGGDKPFGKLISPEFTIERPWITFLIGGGSHKDRTCMNLVVDGKTVRTATGEDAEKLKAFNWNVRELAGRKAHIEIVDAASEAWGHINVDQIEFRDEPRGAAPGDLVDQPDYGTMSLALLEAGSARASISPALTKTPTDELFAGGTEQSVAPVNEKQVGVVNSTHTLKPGESATVSVIVSWHFPNLRNSGAMVGQFYAKRFTDARAVATFVQQNKSRLFADTRLWHDTYYDSTLPWWLLDRMHSTVSYLATTTAQWWANGRFWGWEGCGCCHGTCGHVWNYAQAMARLFPRFERTVREMQDFAPGIGLAENGAIGFRGQGWKLWAGDSQGGYILKAYREHLISPDGEFLKRNWKNIRKAMEFLIQEDGNADGLIESQQHQTYDENYFGANTFVGALYLGALRAAEEMANEMGDTSFAQTCHKIFESGSRLSSEKLFNGEYFIQIVDLKKHPDWQYADGCLADQMFGQCWAHQVDLGYLYPTKQVRSAMESVWKYCWAPDVGPQSKAHTPERWYAFSGEAGLFICTWPKGKHLGPKSTRYRDEVWTGIEYQVATHMVYEGMITEALAVCRAVHERYHPSKHNPYNEIECGDHYSRALASWGMLTSLSGFTYSGPARKIGFGPKLTPEKFKCLYTSAEAWGSFSQTVVGGRQQVDISVKWGRLALKQISLNLANGITGNSVAMSIDGKPVTARSRVSDGKLQLIFDETIIPAGKSIAILAS